MRKITFKEIKQTGNKVVENDTFIHFHYPEMLIRYDSNFIEFTRMPELSEYVDAENYLREYHKKRGQNHLRFYFPENEKLSDELRNYLTKMGYTIGISELYAVSQGFQYEVLKV